MSEQVCVGRARIATILLRENIASTPARRKIASHYTRLVRRAGDVAHEFSSLYKKGGRSLRRAHLL
jgi:hypothetical protein